MRRDRRAFLAQLGSAAAASLVPVRWDALAREDRDAPQPAEERYWLNNSREFGRLDPAKLQRALKHRDNMQPAKLKIAAGANWEFVGPSDILDPPSAQPSPIGQFPTSGRINAVAFDPSNRGTFYAGSSNGGVWKATNALTTSDPAWQPMSDNWPILCVSSIAVDASGQNVYVGTGDCPASGKLAMGVMKSTNGGVAWSNVSGAFFAGSRISRVVIHPDSQSTILAAEFDPDGSVWVSTDAGTTWTSVVFSVAGWLCIEFGVASNGNRSCYALDKSGALWRADNGVATWKQWSQLSTPVKASGENRPQIACSPLTAGKLYMFSPADAKIWSHNNYGNGAASTWQDITYDYADNLSQATGYNYCMACSSTTLNVKKSTDVLYVGAYGVWQSVIGSGKWHGVESSQAKNLKDATLPGHADMHALAISPFDPSFFLIGNDSGVYSAQYSFLGVVVIPLNKNLAVSEVYKAAYSTSDTKTILAGMQDTGTAASAGNLSQWTHVYGGDGGSCVINPTNSLVQFATSDFYSDLELAYTKDGWNSSILLLGNRHNKPINAATKLIVAEASGAAKWFLIDPPLLLDPFNLDSLYLATSYLYRYTISTGVWESQLGNQRLASNRTVRAVAITSSNGGKSGNRIYTGSHAGEVWMSNDAGGSWNQITGNLHSTSGAGGVEVNAISVNPSNPNDVLVVLYASGENPTFLMRCSNTTAASPTWVDLTQSASADGLPSVYPLRTIARDPSDPENTWYVGGDVGVFYTDSAGATWANATLPLGLPNVSVSELQTVGGTQSLYAATYGRGVYRIALSSGKS
jgi:photosystem II stability/assembly factor-like uncharacterized protein